MSNARAVVITGIGLITCQGVGWRTVWDAWSGTGAIPVDSQTFAPFTIHPLPEIDWSQQIPKRGDQRQMETWQRTGTYAAGLALEDAGMKDDEALVAAMDMVVAAGGGERDTEVDAMILARAGEAGKSVGQLVNEVLTTELRPTLFLAQLSNLLAGNISIVHKVTGSSRTFMGEEGAGMSAIHNAHARIRAGQSTHALVGGAFNSAHLDMLLGYEMTQDLSRDGWAPVAQRPSDAPGIIHGSGGAFLVLEERGHAEARGAHIHAVLDDVAVNQAPAGQRSDSLQSTLSAVAVDGIAAVMSAATGSPWLLKDECTAMRAALPDASQACVTSAAGHLREAQFPLAVAAAALSLSHGIIPAPLAMEGGEAIDAGDSMAVTGMGLQQAEGAVRLSRYQNGGAGA